MRGFGRRFGVGGVHVQSTSTDKKNLFISSPPLSITQLIQLTDPSLSEVNIEAQ